MSDVVFREKTASQDNIYSHLCECGPDFKPPLYTKVDIKDYADKIFKNSMTFEAWFGDTLVGLVAAYLNDQSRQSGYITNVSVLKNFEGRGIGSILMRMCLKKSIQEKFQVILLETNKDKNRAIKMYHDFGFREFDQNGDLVMMKLNLEEMKNNDWQS